MAKNNQQVVLFDDLQRSVLQSKIMRFSVPEQIAWLKTQGHDISEKKLQRVWTEIQTIKDAKVLQIASRGLFEQHLERIENLELVLKLSWRNYHKLAASDPYKSQRVLDSIAMQQPLLSQYYEATKFILEKEFPEMIKAFEECKVNDPERILQVFLQKDKEKIEKSKSKQKESAKKD